MQIISLKTYKNGYTGVIEEQDRYVYFNFSEKRGLKRLLEYEKKDFIHYNHFIQMITRFMPYTSFLKKPVRLESVTTEELKKVSCHL